MRTRLCSRRSSFVTLAALAVLAASCAIGLTPAPALAFPGMRISVPTASTAGCITCHNNPSGGTGCSNDTVPRVAMAWSTWAACAACTSADPGVAPCLNSFGAQYQSVLATPAAGRWAAIAMMDADGDGWTNGEELGDPSGTWVGVPDSTTPPRATNDPTVVSHPGDTHPPGSTSTVDLCCIVPTADIDECALAYDTCVDAGTTSCDNDVARPGHSYTCSCATGYDGDSCEICAPGFSDDGGACADLDECTDETDDCDTNATCTNTAGSFTCACDEGWEGDGTACTDVDECTAGTDTCGANEVCMNQVGAAHTCDCEAGFTRATASDPCAVHCADGVLGPDEACDDGDSDADDGCSATCTIEAGFTCSGALGEASTCTLADAGMPDAGGSEDAGPTPDPDAGSPADAGTGGADAGQPPPPPSSDCSCRAAGSGRTPHVWALLLGLGLAISWRRARRAPR